MVIGGMQLTLWLIHFPSSLYLASNFCVVSIQKKKAKLPPKRSDYKTPSDKFVMELGSPGKGVIPPAKSVAGNQSASKRSRQETKGPCVVVSSSSDSASSSSDDEEILLKSVDKVCLIPGYW